MLSCDAYCIDPFEFHQIWKGFKVQLFSRDSTCCWDVLSLNWYLSLFRALGLLNESLLYGFLSWVSVSNTAVLWPLLQGAISAMCNIYSHFILWVSHLVHSKYTYLYTRSTIPFHLRSKKQKIMFESVHCLVSCVVTTLHEES